MVDFFALLQSATSLFLQAEIQFQHGNLGFPSKFLEWTVYRPILGLHKLLGMSIT